MSALSPVVILNVHKTASRQRRNDQLSIFSDKNEIPAANFNPRAITRENTNRHIVLRTLQQLLGLSGAAVKMSQPRLLTEF